MTERARAVNERAEMSIPVGLLPQPHLANLDIHGVDEVDDDRCVACDCYDEAEAP